ncbi:MAG TPA: MgtC/SapB family protein, partial [Pseudorhodoferax sp.]|nr:MgtC/SapB family protein [Pseudorhodoferax sp.]
MNALHFSSLDALAATFVNLASAFGLGALIGIERQVRQRRAGLRTNTLVSVGAA